MAYINTTSPRRPWQPERKAFGGIATDNAKFYNSKAWRKFSLLFKRNNPLCCIEGCDMPTHTTDHKTPLREGGALYDLENLQPLCKFHNSQKTGRQAHRKRGEGG